MATSGVFTNLDALKDAIKIYGIMAKEDHGKAVRKKMADIAYEAARNTITSNKEKIRGEISNLPITKDEGRKRYGSTQYVGQYKLINWERKLRGLDPLGGSRFRKVKKFSIKGPMAMIKEVRKRNVPRNTGPSLGAARFMDGKYKSFIQARIRSINFIRAGWGVAAAFFGRPFSRGDFGPAALQRFSGQEYAGGDIKIIGNDITEYSIFNGTGKYDTRRKKPGETTAPERSSKDQTQAEKIISDALEKGIRAVFADITKYFEQRAERHLKAVRVFNRLK
jgi:hypothetical protein